MNHLINISYMCMSYLWYNFQLSLNTSNSECWFFNFIFGNCFYSAFQLVLQVYGTFDSVLFTPSDYLSKMVNFIDIFDKPKVTYMFEIKFKFQIAIIIVEEFIFEFVLVVYRYWWSFWLSLWLQFTIHRSPIIVRLCPILSALFT